MGCLISIDEIPQQMPIYNFIILKPLEDNKLFVLRKFGKRSPSSSFLKEPFGQRTPDTWDTMSPDTPGSLDITIEDKSPIGQ